MVCACVGFQVLVFGVGMGPGHTFVLIVFRSMVLKLEVNQFSNVRGGLCVYGVRRDCGGSKGGNPEFLQMSWK